jgi:hypothetical protein
MFAPKLITQIITKKSLLATACSCLVASTVVALPLTLFVPSSQAQSRKVRYVPPSNVGAPRVSVPGATRSAGCEDGRCLIGLVPDLEAKVAPVPQTLAKRPTMYFLVPQIDGLGYFSLFETDPNLGKGKRIYRVSSFPVKVERAGIITFKLPDDAPALELNKNYIWEFKVADFVDSNVVTGTIRRIAPTPKLILQLPKLSSPVDRAALLAQEGVWFETVQTLADALQLKQVEPDISNEWTALLQSTKLDRVISLPFTSITKPVPKPESNPSTSPRTVPRYY